MQSTVLVSSVGRTLIPRNPPPMKMFCLSLPHSLRIAVVLAFLPFAAGTAQAENPFKFLGAKAKQGLSKVKQVVHPRRIGAALQNLKPAPLKPAPRVAVRPLNPSDYPDATRPTSGDPYVDGSQSPNRPDLSRPQPPPRRWQGWLGFPPSHQRG